MLYYFLYIPFIWWCDGARLSIVLTKLLNKEKLLIKKIRDCQGWEAGQHEGGEARLLKIVILNFEF